jgi:hypothetical protein
LLELDLDFQTILLVGHAIGGSFRRKMQEWFRSEDGELERRD